MAEYDMAQTALIHLIRQCYQLFDVGAIGALRSVGKSIAADSKFDLDKLEGAVEEVEPGVFGLPLCPFAGAIDTFKGCCGDMPEEIYILADYANGQGEAWVSAFCGIHQSLRKAEIGDSYQQIGCRSGDKVNIAVQEIVSNDRAEELLQNYACVYAR